MIKLFCSVTADAFFYTARFAHDVASDALDLSGDVLSWAEDQVDRRMWDWWKSSVN